MAIGIKHQHLAQSVLLEESGSPLVIRSIILFGAMLVGLFIIWALIAEVDEVAIAKGEIVPPSKLQQVQSLVGGRVAEILVKNGEAVNKDQVILRFDRFAPESELRQLQSQQVSLRAQKQRLEAFFHNQPVNLHATGQLDGARQTQALLLRQLLTTQKTGKDIYQERVRQIKANIAEVSGRKKFLEEKKATLDEELSMRNALLASGMTTKLNMLNLRRQVADVESNLAEIQPRLTRLESELNEAADQLKKNESDVRERALTELGRVNDELASLDEQIKRSEETLRHSEIRAPTNGRIHGLKTHTIGAVINRGDVILEVVPQDNTVIAEVQISQRDVGHVKVGQEVKLRVTAYDFSRYGIAMGKLTDISPAALLDKNGTPYHKGTVALENPYVGPTPGLYPVMAGMTLNADIKTGSKTMMTYLLKPIYASAKQSFRER